MKIVANEAISRRRSARRRRIMASLFVAARGQKRSSEPHEKESADELQNAIEGALQHLTDGNEQR